jgi:hypothetical protein
MIVVLGGLADVERGLIRAGRKVGRPQGARCAGSRKVWQSLNVDCAASDRKNQPMARTNAPGPGGLTRHQPSTPRPIRFRTDNHYRNTARRQHRAFRRNRTAFHWRPAAGDTEGNPSDLCLRRRCLCRRVRRMQNDAVSVLLYRRWRRERGQGQPYILGRRRRRGAMPRGQISEPKVGGGPIGTRLSTYARSRCRPPIAPAAEAINAPISIEKKR